jgi:hypothetical protein
MKARGLRLDRLTRAEGAWGGGDRGCDRRGARGSGSFASALVEGIVEPDVPPRRGA